MKMYHLGSTLCFDMKQRPNSEREIHDGDIKRFMTETSSSDSGEIKASTWQKGGRDNVK